MLLKTAFFHFPAVPTQTSAFWGIVVAVLLSTPYFLGRRALRARLALVLSRDGPVIAAISLLSAAAAFLWFLAMGETGAGPVALLSKPSILYSFILGVLILREPARLSDLFGFLLAAAGIALIATLSGEVPKSSAGYLLSAAFLFSLQSLLIKRFARELDGVIFAYARAALMGVFMGAGLALAGYARPIGVGHALLLGLSVVCGVILGRAFYFQAHLYLPISRLNTVLLIEPILIMSAGFALWNEPVPPRKIAGTVLLLAGLWALVGRDWRGGMEE